MYVLAKWRIKHGFRTQHGPCAHLSIVSRIKECGDFTPVWHVISQCREYLNSKWYWLATTAHLSALLILSQKEEEAAILRTRVDLYH